MAAEVAEKEAAAAQLAAQEEAAVHIQGLWRTREARKMMSLMMHQVFEKVWDPATGQCYYHNKRTGESSWVKPTVFGDHDDLEIL